VIGSRTVDAVYVPVLLSLWVISTWSTKSPELAGNVTAVDPSSSRFIITFSPLPENVLTLKIPAESAKESLAFWYQSALVIYSRMMFSEKHSRRSNVELKTSLLL
jgi:hypothetical protein